MAETARLASAVRASLAIRVAKVKLAVEVADYAQAATAPTIKAAAGKDLMAGVLGNLLKGYGGPDSLRMANLEQLHSACASAGEKMPAYRVGE